MNVEYIPGDLVYFGGEKAMVEFQNPRTEDSVWVRVIEDDDENRSWNASLKEEIDGIPLTAEILEKNGWKKSTGWFIVGGKKGYKFTKELEDDCERSRFGDLQICQCENLRDWNYINECNNDFLFEFTFVHELQHILFAFGINSEMEV